MQVGGHFDQLQSKMKTQGEETQDYIQNIEIQVDNFIKKKHRSTNDQDAIIKEIRDKVTSSNDRATLAVSHLDTFTVLVSLQSYFSFHLFSNISRFRIPWIAKTMKIEGASHSWGIDHRTRTTTTIH